MCARLCGGASSRRRPRGADPTSRTLPTFRRSSKAAGRRKLRSLGPGDGEVPHYATPLRCGQAPLGERLQEARRASEALAGELQRARGCAERERGRAEEASDATAAAAARADRAEGLAEAAERARREEREYLERRIRLLQEEAERLAEQRAESVARAALLEQRLSESEEAAVTGRGAHEARERELTEARGASAGLEAELRVERRALEEARARAAELDQGLAGKTAAAQEAEAGRRRSCKRPGPMRSGGRSRCGRPRSRPGRCGRRTSARPPRVAVSCGYWRSSCATPARRPLGRRARGRPLRRARASWRQR